VASAPYRFAKHSDPQCADLLEVRGHEPGTLEGTPASVLLETFAEADARERAERSPDEPARTSAIVAALEPMLAGATLVQIGDARAYLFRPAPTHDLPVPLAPRFCPEVFLDDGPL